MSPSNADHPAYQKVLAWAGEGVEPTWPDEEIKTRVGKWVQQRFPAFGRPDSSEAWTSNWSTQTQPAPPVPSRANVGVYKKAPEHLGLFDAKLDNYMPIRRRHDGVSVPTSNSWQPSSNDSRGALG